MRHARLASVLTGVLLLTAPLSVARAAEAAPTYDVSPAAGSSTEPRGGYFVFAAQLGRLSQSVALRNDTDAPLALRLSAVDALTAPKGGSSFALDSDVPAATATWIALSRTSLTLAPKSTQTVPFVITVPRDAQSGVHMAGISVTSPAPPNKPTAAGQGQAGASIDVQARRVVAVQVYVPGPAEPFLVITGVTPVARPDGLTLDIKIDNAGHGFTKGEGVITVPDDGFRYEFQFDTVIPGTSMSYPIPWSVKHEKDTHHVRVELRYDGMTPRSEAAVFVNTFTVSEAVQKEQAQRQVVPGNKKSGGLPFGAVGGGVLAAIVGMLLGRRSKAARPVPPVTGAVIDLRPTILICDGDPDARFLYRQVMETTGATVFEAADGLECLRLADSATPDLVLLDLVLPGMNGLDVLTELHRLHPLTPVVIMSGVLSGEQRDRSLQLGAAESLDKYGLVARIPALVDRYQRRSATPDGRPPR